jgi:hypothetical protein
MSETYPGPVSDASVMGFRGMGKGGGVELQHGGC